MDIRAINNTELRAVASGVASTESLLTVNDAWDEIMRRMKEKDDQIRKLKSRTETETLKKELEALKRRMHDAEMMLSKKAVGEAFIRAEIFHVYGLKIMNVGGASNWRTGMVELMEAAPQDIIIPDGLIVPPQAVELRSGGTQASPRGIDGFSCEGGVLVVANALLYASEPLAVARRVLQGLKSGAQSAVLNGHLYVSTVLIQSVLDNVARLCDNMTGGNADENIYFHNYEFLHSDIMWVSKVQKEIAAFRFMGKCFNDQANHLKHERPWVGGVSEGLDGLKIPDSEGTCFLYDFLIPVYKRTVTIMSRLCKSHNQPVPAFPSL